MQMPLNERCVLTQLAQSESEYACATLASNWGQLSRRMSCLLLWTGVLDPQGVPCMDLCAKSIDCRRESDIGTSVHVLSHGSGAHEGMNWTAIV